MNKTLDKIEAYILYTTIFLFPIATIPLSPNLFVVSKLSVLTLGILSILAIKAIRIIYEGKLKIRVGKYDLPVAVIAIAYLASSILRTPNKMEAFLLPGNATIIISSGLLYFLINQTKKKHVALTLFLSAVVFSVISLLAYSGVLAKIPQLPPSMRSQFFTPEGGYLPSAIFLASLLPLGVSLIISEKDIAKRILFGVSTIVTLAAIAISIFNLLPGKQFAIRFPSFSNDWSIAVDALKESPILGIGPGNYLTAFNRFRPLTYNTTDLWALKFTTSRSFYLTLLTETGMIGAAGIIMLLISLYRNVKTDLKEKKLVKWKLSVSPNMLSLALLLVLLVFFPATLIIKVAVFIILATVTSTKLTTLNLKTQSSETHPTTASRLPAMLIGLPIILAVLFVGYNAGRILIAERTFKTAIDALARNEAQLTYEQMIKTINLNPRVDRYHTTFAQVNLALANSIAGKERITDTDRTNVAQLVQAAIRESKAAVALNPFRAGSWTLLARTYQAIMPLAQGADVFAVKTFNQAVALDSINPNLRIGLGGIYYGQGDFDTAIRIFELAIATKTDHANAHYNLAFALRDKGELDRAINQMTIVLSLIVDKDSNDYEVARQALEDLQEKKRVEAQSGDELTPPKEPKAPVLEPPLELPEDSEPPEPPLTPTPTPSPEDEEEGELTVTPELTPTPTPTP
jgi:tetratricopeptide (TPR) repeat protein